MSFYVTLLSDSSTDYFPNNNSSHFITKLPKSIELKGEWEVGLAEILYPHTWNNVSEKNNLIEYILEDDGPRLIQHVISPGYYETPDDIFMNIFTPETKNKVIFSYDPAIKRITITKKFDVSVILRGGMAKMLGFKPMKIASEGGRDMIEMGKFNVDLHADYHVLMLYTDIVEPQIVGGAVAPLLQVIRVKGKDGETIREHYKRPHYLPLTRKIIDTVEIVIKTNTDVPIPFERGCSYVKLHFRRRY